MKTQRKHEFDITEGDWRLVGTYDEKDNVVFYRRNKVYRVMTVPQYEVWKIASRFNEMVEEFEQEENTLREEA